MNQNTNGNTNSNTNQRGAYYDMLNHNMNMRGVVGARPSQLDDAPLQRYYSMIDPDPSSDMMSVIVGAIGHRSWTMPLHGDILSQGGSMNSGSRTPSHLYLNTISR